MNADWIWSGRCNDLGAVSGLQLALDAAKASGIRPSVGQNPVVQPASCPAGSERGDGALAPQQTRRRTFGGLALPSIRGAKMPCLYQDHMEHHVRMSGRQDQMLTAEATFARKPVFHDALACTGPTHHRLDCAICRAKLEPQRHGPGGAIIDRIRAKMHICARLDPYFGVLLRQDFGTDIKTGRSYSRTGLRQRASRARQPI